jgi:ABC-type taurine transport system ATPase subunit
MPIRGPPEVEGEATNRAIMIADMAGVPLYVVHVSCEQAHEAIRRARQKGMRVYGEPLIQHLTLDESEYFNPDWDHAARRVMSPPFRNKLHQDSLWAGLQAGSLQVVATDHCAFTTAQKRTGIGNFSKIPNGTGGLEDRMPVLWTTGVNTGRLTMNEFVAVTSTNIAKILGHVPEKGRHPRRRRRRPRGVGPQAQEDDLGGRAAVGDRLQRLRGLRSHRPAALRSDARQGGGRREQGQAEARSRQVRGARSEEPCEPALSTWKEIVAPRKVERTAFRRRGFDGSSVTNNEAPAGRSGDRPGIIPALRKRHGACIEHHGRTATIIRCPASITRGGTRSVTTSTVVTAERLGLTFRTNDGDVVALDVNLTIGKGEFVSFIGPSGCGKTTFLRTIADLEQPTSGTHHGQRHLARGGAQGAGLRLRVPGAGAVSVAHHREQRRAAARNHGLWRPPRRRAHQAHLDLVNLEGFEKKFPWQLSGGMQQRASIARALAFDADLLLMDEPFGALDEIVRDHLNSELAQALGGDAEDHLLRHTLDPGGGVSLVPRSW